VPHTANDIAEMQDLLKAIQEQNNFSSQQIEEMVVQGYYNAYQFLTKHKQELLQLSNKLEDKGVVYEHEISASTKNFVRF